MDVKEFTKKFAEQFDDVDVESLSPSSQFRDVEEWDSLTALAIIAMVDAEYRVELTGEEIGEANTISDIFDKVSSKL